MKKVDIGIIGALAEEVEALISKLDSHEVERLGSVEFHLGILEGKRVAIARCGIGKVFAAICTEAMIIGYAPDLIVNTGVGGALARGLSVTDTVIADKLVQHDMDTSPIGDPKGLISGINKVWFETDERARDILVRAADRLGLKAKVGSIASGDQFVATSEVKDRITADFGASACEMEGAAIGQVCFVNRVPYGILRAISDGGDEQAFADYPAFLAAAAETATNVMLRFVESWG